MTLDDAELGAALRLHINPRALAAWAGTNRLSALAARLPALEARPLVPAAAPLALLVAGTAVPRALLRHLGEAFDELVRRGLLELDGDLASATLTLAPLGDALMACDRLDAPDASDRVCWPDDSSYHLAGALPPGRRARWLDLATGSGFAPLARPELAEAIAGTDGIPRATRYARLGAALSGRADQLVVYDADISEAFPMAWHGACDLVSCNAPIPDGHPYRPRWLSAEHDFVTQAFARAATMLAPTGMFVIHAQLRALRAAIAAVDGERVVVTYTPEGLPGFAVGWWRPSGKDRLVVTRRDLTVDQPHVTFADYEAAR